MYVCIGSLMETFWIIRAAREKRGSLLAMIVMDPVILNIKMSFSRAREGENKKNITF